MHKKIISLIASAFLGITMLATSAFAVNNATALDDIGDGSATSTTATATAGENGGKGVFGDDGIEIDSTASNIANLTEGIGLDEETVAKARETATPIVKAVNYGLGILLALFGTYLLAITILDMIYIASPSFIRNIGSNGGAPAMDGQGQPRATGFSSLISDDCRAALAESAAAVGGAPAGGMGGMGGMDPMMGGMGGMGMPGMGGMGMPGMGGMGGMGMPGMGGGAPAAPKPKFKQTVLCYLKKRVFTLVLLGVCIAVFTCTCLTDIGLSIGNWITNTLAGSL